MVRQRKNHAKAEGWQKHQAKGKHRPDHEGFGRSVLKAVKKFIRPSRQLRQGFESRYDSDAINADGQLHQKKFFNPSGTVFFYGAPDEFVSGQAS